MAGFFQRWRESRTKRAAEAAEFRQEFDEFIEETRRILPRQAGDTPAGLYRYAWKRAEMLKFICEHDLIKDEETARLAARWKARADCAAARYRSVAPTTLYGQRRLEMSVAEQNKILDRERKRIWPEQVRPGDVRPFACIYVGRCKNGRVYVGQTVGEPEMRFVQHRAAKTGPFKRGEQYVEWKVIEGPVATDRLNERESYFIGFYAANVDGYNDTTGNHIEAYRRGCEDRQARRNSTGG